MRLHSSLRTLVLFGLMNVMASGSGGQTKWTVSYSFNAGANIFLTNLFDKAVNKGYKFPGVRAYGAMSLNAQKGGFMLHYGPSVSFYTKTIGANLNRFVDDLQLDCTQFIGIGAASRQKGNFIKQVRTLHNGDYYNFVSDAKMFGMVGTNLIFNINGRHQVVGSVNLNYGPVSINYYNDGPPFNMIALGDGFDRYWTGGGHIIWHGKNGSNVAELSYDQFTGYAPLLYELSNILGINVPVYENGNDRRHVIRNYNSSAYHLKVRGGKYLDFDAGVIGNLATRGGRFFGIQDIIHLKGRMSLHPNNDRNRFFIGGSYKNQWNDHP